jgi:hypothetical protein
LPTAVPDASIMRLFSAETSVATPSMTQRTMPFVDFSISIHEHRFSARCSCIQNRSRQPCAPARWSECRNRQQPKISTQRRRGAKMRRISYSCFYFSLDPY